MTLEELSHICMDMSKHRPPGCVLTLYEVLNFLGFDVEPDQTTGYHMHIRNYYLTQSKFKFIQGSDVNVINADYCYEYINGIITLYFSVRGAKKLALMYNDAPLHSKFVDYYLSCEQLITPPRLERSTLHETISPNVYNLESDTP